MDATKAGNAVVSGCALVFIVLAGCAGPREDRAATTMTTGAGAGARMIMNDDAAMVLTRSRCQRESACDNVGASRRFTSRDSCTLELFPEAETPLRPEACPMGVSEPRLAACLADIKSTRCIAPRATSDEPLSCRQSELCIGQ